MLNKQDKISVIGHNRREVSYSSYDKSKKQFELELKEIESKAIQKALHSVGSDNIPI